ncbi:type I-E CRISPR-associated protein Cse2/CasB [Streptomyces sp. NPDC004376]
MTSATPAAPTPSKEQRPSDRFVKHVHDLCADNRTRAELRRGIGLPVERCNYAHRYLVPFISRTYKEGITRDRRHAYYVVAALIAGRPRAARDAEPPGWSEGQPPADWYARPNLGASLGQAVAKGVLKEGSAESTLHLMTRQTAEAVRTGLPALVRQLANGGVPVDWTVLLEDLANWNRYHDRVATRWLESYFRALNAEDAPEAEDERPDNDENDNTNEENER